MSYSFNNLILNNLDSAGTLNIGASTSAITFGKVDTITTFPGPIVSVQPISFNDIDTTAANTMFIGKEFATKIEIGKSLITTEIKGNLIIKDNIDTSSTTILTIGGVASALTITPNTTVAGTLTVQPPSSNLHAATKAYVDGVASGLDVKASVDLKTIAALPSNVYTNGTLGEGAAITATVDGILSVDGIQPTINMRILVTEDTVKNGIYTVTNTGSGISKFVLTRSTDTDTVSEVSKGLFTYVLDGTVAGNGYVLTNDIVTMGTTGWTFSQLSSLSSFNQANITGTGILATGSMTGNFGPLVIQNLATPPVNTEGGLYYDTDDKKLLYYNGTIWGELGGSNSSNGVYSNCLVKQIGSIPSSAINVYCTKVTNNITLNFPSFDVPDVVANSQSFISNDITAPELQPTFPCTFPVIINDKPAYVKFVNNNLEFIKSPSVSWDAGNNVVQGFTINYNTNSTTLATGTWGAPFPSSTVSMSSSTAVTLKKTETATITFTFSGDPTTTFDLNDVTGTGAAHLTNLLGTGLTRTATFTPPDTNTNDLITYTFDIAAGVFTATYLNTAALQLTISADTRLPSISTYSPNSFGAANNANLVLVFTETVVKNTGNVVIYKDGVIWSTIGINAPTITLSQTSFPNDTLTIDQTGDMVDNAHYYVLIDAGALKDVSDNLFTGITSSTEWKFTTYDTADTLVPSVTLSIASGGLMTAIGDTRTINIVFSEFVTDFISSDITLTGLTLSAFTFNGTSGSFIATSTSDECKVIINAGVCADLSTNPNTASNDLLVKEGILIYTKLTTSHALGTTVNATGCSADGTLIVVGGSGSNIRISSNSGSSWATISTGLSFITTIHVSNDSTKIIAAGSGWATSTDSGNSFTLRNNQSHAGCQNYIGNIFITGQNSSAVKLWRSIDGVNSELSTSTARLWNSLCVSDNGVVIVGTNKTTDPSLPGSVFVSQDSGVNWFTPPGMSTNRIWSDARCSASGSEITLHEVGLGGDIWQSSDSGSNFVKKNLTDSWRNGSMSSDGVNRVGATINNLKVSENSGATWENGIFTAPAPTGGDWSATTISSDGTKTYNFYSDGETYAN
jgi:hypothetical protein